MSPAEGLFSVESVDAQTAGALGFMPRIMVLTTLPHRRPGSHRFERVNGRHTLQMCAPRRVGLPYGVYPRLILIYLTTAAVRSKSREIELGRSPTPMTSLAG
ncbi:MAG: replication protein RepA [Thermoanaerobaculia bacterium]